ncbi:MAG: alpha/beta fold hydrolase [Streptosporangiaceae bacterium]
MNSLPDDNASSVMRIPVTLHVRAGIDSGPGWKISGDLYQRAGEAPRLVQVLVPGLTYDRRYWTMPGQYNYADHMARAGHAVFVFDRIGTGRSSRPEAEQVTAEVHVAVLHQLVAALRDGRIADQSFDQVVVVGHSYGSGIGLMEATQYQDVDGLIVSGMLHAFTDLYEEVRGFFHPAADDPILTATAPPVGYLTQRPGLRSRMLEHPPTVEPRMSEYNELIKSTGTLGEGETLPQTYLPNQSVGVRVPVLLVVGQQDALFCGESVGSCRTSAAVHEYEQEFYSPEAQLETHVIPDCGHSLNLHTGAQAWFDLVVDWIGRKVPGAPVASADVPSTRP